MSSFSMETQKSVRVFLGKDLVGRWGDGGGVCLGGMINESTPCCHLYFGIQSKAQFSVKYDFGLSRRRSLMLMYEQTGGGPSCYRTEGGNYSFSKAA